MKKTVIFVFVLFTFLLHAQDLTGRWVSTLTYDGDIDEMTLKTFNNGVYSGDSYDTSYGGEFCKYTFTAKYDPATKVFLGKDVNLIEKTENHRPVVYRLEYSKKGDQEFLSGYGRIINPDGSLDYPFRAVYTKPAKVEKKPERVVSPEEIAVIKAYKQNRKNPVKASLRLNNPKIKIKIHDYGKQDHDSVSVIYNDQLIAYKIPIESENKEFDIELSPDQNNQLTFIAHNLGDVAPNTTYVEILADDKVFKYTLFTDLQKNSVINLRLNK